MCIEYYNGHLVNGFTHAMQAQKVILKYRTLKTKQFADFGQPIDDICGYQPKLINPKSATFVVDDVISYEAVSILCRHNNLKKLKSLSNGDGRIYFVGDITDEIVTGLGTAIASSVFMYTLMIARYETKNHTSGCSEFYPQKDTIPCWLTALTGFDHDTRCHLTLDLFSGMFFSKSADECFEALGDGRSYMTAIEAMLNNVRIRVNKRFPDFADVTDELFETCLYLAKKAMINNTYYIEIGK